MVLARRQYSTMRALFQCGEPHAAVPPCTPHVAMPIPCSTHGPQPVLPSQQAWPLHGSAASRQIEQQALAAAAPEALMARAGLAVARLAVATAPGARRVWIACGPGNNGGDGLVAALHLQALGWQVAVSLLGDTTKHPVDAAHALQQAQQSGVAISTGLPAAQTLRAADLAIDALLGLGQRRAPQGPMAEAVRQLNAGPAPVLAVDRPTGLCGDTGVLLGDLAALSVRATHTPPPGWPGPRHWPPPCPAASMPSTKAALVTCWCWAAPAAWAVPRCWLHVRH